MAGLRKKNRGLSSDQGKSFRKKPARKNQKRLVNKRSSKRTKDKQGKSNRNIKGLSIRKTPAVVGKNAKHSRSIDVDKETKELVFAIFWKVHSKDIYWFKEHFPSLEEDR